jgi:hypothetical protein
MILVSFLIAVVFRLGDSDSTPLTDSPEHGEIWVSSWKSVPRDLAYVTPMIWAEGDFRPGTENESIDPEPLARASRSIPKGRRVILWYRYFRSFWGAREDGLQVSGRMVSGPWAEFAVAKVQSEWSRFLQLYKYCGGELDFVVGDCEEWGRFTSWNLSEGQIEAIREDVRFGQAMYGCPSLAEMTAGIALDDVCRPQRSNANLRWNCAIGKFTAAVMSRAIWDPAVATFPAIRGCNYDGKRMLDQPAPDLNGHCQPSDNVFGTSPSPVAYGAIQQAATAWFIDPANSSRLSLTGTRRLERGPWQSFLMDMQLGRACRRGSPDKPMMPWVALRTYAGDTPGFVGYPAAPEYWSEMVRHYALLGTSAFLWWNTTSLPGPGGTSVPATGRDEMAREFNVLVTDINARTRGVVGRTVTSEPIAFDAPIIVTGAIRIDGRRIWRVTARPGIRRLRDSQSGEVVELPEGQPGFWLESNDDREPRFVVAAPDQN